MTQTGDILGTDPDGQSYLGHDEDDGRAVKTLAMAYDAVRTPRSGTRWAARSYRMRRKRLNRKMEQKASDAVVRITLV